MKVKVKKEGKQKTYKIVDSWNDVTLEKWQQLVLGKRKSKTQEAKETIKALSDLPVKLIEEMALSMVNCSHGLCSIAESIYEEKFGKQVLDIINKHQL